MDPESQTQPDHEGYHALSQLMSFGRGMAIFKRFNRLNAKNLLLMQAELLHLESKLNVIYQAGECCSDPDWKSYDTDMLALLNASTPRGQMLRQTLFDIRSKLKEYNSTLLDLAKLGDIPRPRQYDLNLLHSWLYDLERGGGFLSNVPIESQPWDEKDMNELIILWGRPTIDNLTTLLAERFVPCLIRRTRKVFNKKLNKNAEQHLGLVRVRYIRVIARILTVILSTAIPSLAILILYYIHSLFWRIFAIVCFSFLFAMIVAFTTSAKPVEVFAATAALASVQVVFVGSTTVLSQ